MVSVIVFCQVISAVVSIMLQGPNSVLVEHPEVRMIVFEDGIYPSYMLDGTMADFYKTLLDSPYIDWLSEYNSGNKTINRGTFTGVYKIRVHHDNKTIMYRDMFSELKRQQNLSNIPPDTENTIYMFHYPTNISCDRFGGSHIGRYSFIYDCDWLRLPLRKNMFWAGVAFVCLFLILLCIWPILTCNTLEGFGHCRCGFDLSGKTIYHITMIILSIVIFFVGGFISGVAYINNQEDQFRIGIIVLCVSGSIFVIWLLSLIVILASPVLTELKCCFNSDRLCCFQGTNRTNRTNRTNASGNNTKSIKVFNILYGVVLMVCVTLALVLVLLSFGSNVQITASHELIEIITGNWYGPEPKIGLSNAGWRLGMGNYCQFEWDTLHSSGGYTHYVQKGWSNMHQKCISGL